jgi:integrase
VVKARVGVRTFRDYETLLRLHIRPVLGSRLIGTISQVDLQSLYAQMFERGLSARTIEYTNAVLVSAFRQAVRWKMLAEDPCVGVDLPRVKHKEMETLSVEEYRRFLDVAEKSAWFPVLALTTGMRPSEYLALRWTDIDWQRGTASVCRRYRFRALKDIRRYQAKAQRENRKAAELLAQSTAGPEAVAGVEKERG